MVDTCGAFLPGLSVFRATSKYVDIDLCVGLWL